MKRTRFLFLPALAILLLLIGLLGLGSQRLGLVQASGTAVQVTNCNDSGPGSLRDTIASAASGSSISFRLSCDIKLNSTLSISQTLTLTGEGQQVILDGQHAVQVLSVNGGVTLTLKALTIANSSSSGSGISNWGTLRISNSTISGNAGVGIDNEGGTVRISNSTVSGNSGDGIFSMGTASISNSTISGNASDGIFSMGTASISNSTVSGNASDGIYNITQIDSSRSGAIHFGSTMRISNSTDCNASYSIISTMCITNSTISGNAGGGIGNSDGTVRISNSTISGNSGSGIDNDSGMLDTTLSISNSTISGNSGSGIDDSTGPLRISNSTVSGNSGSGIDNDNSGTVRIGGSIVANNTGSNCAGILTDQGYNLSSDTSCHLSAKTSLQNSDAKLDPSGLQNNGGPTQTIALQPDSPAVDRIPVGSQCPATDQRGVSRPQGPKCDIGAFETTAADGLRVMTHVVNSFQLAKGLQTSLDQQVQAVLAALRAQQTAQACQDLTSFINYVQAQSGKGLTRAQVTTLLQEAAVIHTRLGC